MGSYELKTERNSLLLALFIMQYTLILPFTKVISPTLLTAGTSLLILFLFVLLNKTIRINLHFAIALAIINLAILLKVLLFPSSDISIFLVFAYTALPAAFAAAYDYDFQLVLKNLYKISLLSFLLVFWYPFIGEQSYMRFGYAVLPNVLFILCELLYNKKKRLGIIIAGAICFALLVEMFVFGARGSFFSLLLFFALEELLINRENLKRKLAMFLGVLLVAFNIGPIIDFIYNTLLKLGIRSYALIKYRMQLNRGIEIASSGRVNLYDTAIEQLKQSPIFGLPILLTNEDGSMVYVHNLFLQTWMDLGIVGLAILIGFLLFVIWKIWRRDIGRNDRILIAAVFSISIGRLLFSSVLWRRPEFWLFVFMSMKMGKSQNNIEV